jgi:uncharacterized protein YozE (UPF0346 family)
LLRRNDENPIGTFARGVLEADGFPGATKSYFVVDAYLRNSGASLEKHELFDGAWREFLRDEVRKELVAHPIAIDRVLLEHIDNGRAHRVRGPRNDLPEGSANGPVQLERVVDLFDRLMPEALMNNPGHAQEIDTILCFKIEGAGEWTLDVSKGMPSSTCTRGVSKRALCTVEIGVDGFGSMLSDPNAGMKLYFQKRLRIFGDLTHVPKIALVFELALAQRSHS